MNKCSTRGIKTQREINRLLVVRERDEGATKELERERADTPADPDLRLVAAVFLEQTAAGRSRRNDRRPHRYSPRNRLCRRRRITASGMLKFSSFLRSVTLIPASLSMQSLPCSPAMNKS